MANTQHINIIAAVTTDLGLGRNGDLLFHISADLKRFKQLTMGYPIIMGRNTFESLPKGALPGRRNIVISRNPDYSPLDAERASSLDEAIALCHEAQEVFIIGGAQVYSQAIDKADRLMLTHIDTTVKDADCYFPAINPSQWQVSEQDAWQHDERANVNYRFETLSRIK